MTLLSLGTAQERAVSAWRGLALPVWAVLGPRWPPRPSALRAIVVRGSAPCAPGVWE